MSDKPPRRVIPKAHGHTFSVVLPDWEKRLLEGLAAQHGVTQVEVIRQALKLYHLALSKSGEGKALAFKHKETGEVETVILAYVGAQL